MLAFLADPQWIAFLNQNGIGLILVTLILALVALLFEIRLPLRNYWGLPGFAVRAILSGIHIGPTYPIWGVCFIQDQEQPLPLVACELLDEHSHQVVMRTYTNHQGQYGFKLMPGKYLLRAIKTQYRLPTFLDPENVEVIEVDESFVISVIVLNREVAPVVNLPLVPVKVPTEAGARRLFSHYGRMFIFQLGNAFLFFDILLGLAGLAATKQPFYGLILAVAVVLLFIKLYFLETIRVVTKG
jgi:energy-coupling factor transporter transmembrane protein EcfT